MPEDGGLARRNTLRYCSLQVCLARHILNLQGGPTNATFLTHAIITSCITIALAIASAAVHNTAMSQPAPKPVTTSSGLQIIDTKAGTGASPRAGQTAVVHYTGWLYDNGAKGAKFDFSVDRGQPFEFPLGQGRVIQGWDEGVATMKIGGKRTLIVPPSSAMARAAPAAPFRRMPR